ncbi:MAG TPA: VWA domain-containing protein [Pyrinomonadaceae bacterium]|nr:VWA domain-containing protein [Pyrinomonadaceae bacterium]
MKIQKLLVATLSFSLLSPVLAQQGQKPKESQQEDVVRITSNLKQVNVVVVDKEGRHVADLGPEDFEVIEAGKRQAITNFSYVAVGASETPATAAPAPDSTAVKNAPRVPPLPLRPEQVRRTVALVVDDLGLSLESTGFVRAALKKFVDEQMQPGDQVAIIRTSGDAGALQQLTSDKRQLYPIIERVRWRPSGRGGISPYSTIVSQKETLSVNEGAADNTMADIRAGGDAIARMEQNRADNFAVGSLGSLGYVIQGMKDLPGRKAIVFVSEAFRLFKDGGRNEVLLQALERLTQQANLASTVIYTIDASGLQNPELTAADKVTGYGYLFDKSSLQKMGIGSGPRGAAGGGPTVGGRSIQQGGSTTSSTPPSIDSAQAGLQRLRQLTDERVQSSVQSHSVLSLLAEETGGFLVRNRNDLGAGLQKVMADQKGYYLIGYRPDDATIDPDTGRRQIRELEVKVKRSGLRVRKGTGSYGIPFETGNPVRRTREEQMTAALMSPFAANDVEVRLTSLFGEEQAAGSLIRSLVSIDARNLAFEKEADGTHKTSVDLAAVIFGNNGRAIDQFAHTHTIALSDAEYEQALKHSLLFNFDFPVKQAGAYQLRVAVRDTGSERLGTARQYVEVPDIGSGRLALSGVILRGSNPQAQTINASVTQPQSGDDLQAAPALRRLRQGMFLDYRYAVYNAQLDPATKQPRLTTQMRLFRDEKPVFTGRVLPLDVSQQQDMKRLGAGGRLRLGPDLTPGSYVLQVVVEDANAKEKYRTATQWIDFEIVN